MRYPQVFEAAGVKRVSSVQDGHLAVVDGTIWQLRFWPGVNVGATTPGHFPGELSPPTLYRWDTLCNMI